MRDLAGNSLEFTGIDLLNTKFQLFNFKYQEVSSDLPHSQRWPRTCLVPYCIYRYDSFLLSSSQVITIRAGSVRAMAVCNAGGQTHSARAALLL